MLQLKVVPGLTRLHLIQAESTFKSPHLPHTLTWQHGLSWSFLASPGHVGAGNSHVTHCICHCAASWEYALHLTNQGKDQNLMF